MRTSFMPTTGYLLFGNVFKSKVSPQMMRQCVLQQTKNSASPKSIVTSNAKIFQSSATLNYNGFGYHSANYCTLPAKKTKLMSNFEITLRPNLLNFIKIIYSNFTIKNYDSEFKLQDFLRHSKKAMEVVTTLISESSFSELEGLLTDECREEVKKNVTDLELSKRKHLIMKAEDVLEYFPASVEVIKVPDGDKEKVFVEILVVYSLIENFNELRHGSVPFLVHSPTLESYTVYNAKFIKEFTPGVEDQWTINAINIYRFVEHYTN